MNWAHLARGLVCGLLWAGQAALAADNAQVSRYYEDALQRYQRKDMAGAVIQLKNALRLDKTRLPVHLLLGQALLAQREVVAAEVAFNEALRLGADRSEVVVQLAEAVAAQAQPTELLEDARFDTAGLAPELQARLLVMKAAAAADLGDPAQALKLAEQARALAPGSARPWLAEVPVRVRARQFSEAAAAADKALQLEPAAAEALYLRGSVAHAMGDAATALAWYARALQQDAAHTETLVARAGLHVDAHKDADALRDLAAVEKADPRDPRAAYLRSVVLTRQGDAAGARQALQRVTALIDPVPLGFMRYRPQWLMLGGLAHHALGQPEKALPYLEGVQRELPSSPAARLLAQILLRLGNTDRAIATLDAYLRGAPNDWQATYLLASAHLSQGRHARAAALMQQALRHGDAPEAHGVLGLSLLAGGQVEPALAALEKAVSRDPRQVQAGSALAGLYMHAGRGADAVRVASALVQAGPRSPGLQSLLGSAQLAAGNRAAARRAFEGALALDKTFLEPQVRLAGLDLDENRVDAALRRLNDVIVADNDNIDALLMLAGAYRRQGRFDEAQRWIERADDVAGPDNAEPAKLLVEFHLAREQVDRAKAALARVVRRQPEDLSVLVLSARVSMADDDDSAARATLSRASARAGTQAARLVQIAQLQVEAGDLPGAAHALGKALGERPDFLHAQALMADVEIAQGQLAQAEQRARRIAARHPRLGLGPGLLGDVALARGQPAAAVAAYRQAHQLQPSSESLLRLYGAQQRVNPAAAQQLVAQWLQKQPDDLAVRREHAASLARTGNMPAARAAFEALLQRAPADVEALNNLANVLLALKDPAALPTAERALALAPERPHVIGTAGWAAFRAGQPDRALRLLREARLRDPDNAQTRYFLGTVLARGGRRAEARSELQAALSSPLPEAYAQDARQQLESLD
jgi:putative PEP-CTERM system TPR-repeat lipoprotein